MFKIINILLRAFANTSISHFCAIFRGCKKRKEEFSLMMTIALISMKIHNVDKILCRDLMTWPRSTTCHISRTWEDKIWFYFSTTTMSCWFLELLVSSWQNRNAISHKICYQTTHKWRNCLSRINPNRKRLLLMQLDLNSKYIYIYIAKLYVITFKNIDYQMIRVHVG